MLWLDQTRFVMDLGRIHPRLQASSNQPQLSCQVAFPFQWQTSKCHPQIGCRINGVKKDISDNKCRNVYHSDLKKVENAFTEGAWRAILSMNHSSVANWMSPLLKLIKKGCISLHLQIVLFATAWNWHCILSLLETSSEKGVIVNLKEWVGWWNYDSFALLCYLLIHCLGWST